MTELNEILKASFGEIKADLEKSVENKELFEKLDEDGLNPMKYDAKEHDYTPFLLQTAIDGTFKMFVDAIKGKEDLFAFVFKVLAPDYIAELASKYARAYGLQKERIETKVLAISWIAKHTSDEQQKCFSEVYQAWAKTKNEQLIAEKAKRANLK